MVASKQIIRFIALSFALLLAAAPAIRGADEAKAVEKVDNEAYQSWAKHKPGTLTTGSMKMSTAGQEFTTEMTSKLVEVTPEKAVIEVTSKMNVPGVTVPPQTQKQEIPAKVAKENAALGSLPEGAKGETKDAGTEKVEIDGKSYECKIVEFTSEANGVKVTGKTWASAEIPGGVAKTEAKGDGAQKFDMNLMIEKVEPK